ARRLPPAPAGPPVTVSFSSSLAAGEHAGALQALGYRVVGVAGAADGPAAAGGGPSEAPTARFLVPTAVAEAAPGWWRALAGRADRVLDLAFGPVAVALADVLELHASVTDPKPARRGRHDG
ncbi:MAG TPA: hypothetical protein VG452_06815, partial [Egibacteraceae bacterium]|nr:hypothetical protein [Egibacteraceae bacterium]